MGLSAGLVRALAIFLIVATPTLADAKSSAQRAAKTHAKAAPPAKFAGPKSAAIIVDADTGKVLHEDDADVQSYPASLTKMMTLYLLFGAMERGEVRMTTPMNVSVHAAKQAPSKLGLLRGHTLTVDQAIDALVTKSANDAAVVIAERLGGTEDRFAEKMTATAHAIGMKNTFFQNASGLPDPGQLSTVRDMATLAQHLIKDFPQYYPLFSRMEFVYGGQTIHTHNHLLEFYEGADGIKTGYTAASGFNLVGSAKRDGHRLIAVVFGGATAQSRDRHLAALMDDGFATLAGHPETAIAARQIERLEKNIQVAAKPLTENEAESSGDRDEVYQPADPARMVIQKADLPAPPATNEPAVAAPVTRQVATAAPIAKPAPKQPIVASIPQSRTAPAGTWGVQIGAFSSRATAESQAGTAANKLKSNYPTAVASVQPVVTKGKTIYRARIIGLGQEDMVRACSLIAAKVCRAVPPETERVASR